MSLTAHSLASGPGWQVHDVVCNSGPGDMPFEEQHEAACIAVVTEGTFRYRTRAGAAVLVPGALLLGNMGACYECGHEHGTGDRCLSFHFMPEYLETLNSGTPGTQFARFSQPRLPPLPQLMALVAEAEAARDTRDLESLEELAVRLVGAAAAVLDDTVSVSRHYTSRDERRITDALRRIEAEAHEPISLASLAQDAGISPFHFLRTFRHVTGLSPHQYVLRTRLHRAAVRLRRTSEPVSVIALDVGFNDLSTFNRRFRRLMGMSPGAFRHSV
jgi:AraC-like DNA-binding protein